ncbi:MAG: hypothetical protein QM704_00510 [Anaeromyxobacteraceae bacterium]
MKDTTSKKLRRSRHLARHLTELGRLLHKEVRTEDLLSLDETEALLARSKAVTRRAPDWKSSFPFAEKEQRLSRPIRPIHAEMVYVWTALANDCGVHRLVRLSELDFRFSFDFSPEGILTVISEDLENQMLLDWHKDNGVELLDLEVTGPRWSAAGP